MTFRRWLNLLTLVVIIGIVFLARDELVKAWDLLNVVNLLILALLIPAQLFTYFASAEIMFSYLRAKGRVDRIPTVDLPIMALEMNFVNHVFPSGGVSGISYMTWRLGQYGISAGRATMSQLVRFAMVFAGLVALLPLAVIVVTIDGNVNRWIILLSSGMVVVAIVVAGFLMFMFSSRKKMWQFADFIVRKGNQVVHFLSFKKKSNVLKYPDVEKFFAEMHFDYLSLQKDRSILVKPLIWGVVSTVGEISLFMIAFWSMGLIVNPAPILIAYGVAIIIGVIAVTPGGAGAYETAMIMVLAIAGLKGSEAIAGIILTRVILMLGTIIFGYFFYHRALSKYGNFDPKS